MPPGYGRDIPRPLVPVPPVAALLHNLGAYRCGQIKQFRLSEPCLTDGVFIAITVFANIDSAPAVGRPWLPVRKRNDAQVFAGSAFFQEVEHGLKPFIVRPNGIQHLPDHTERVRLFQGGCGIRIGGNHHGQYDVAHLLARSTPHHAAHRLHHVDLTFARMHEEDGVQRRHIHALGQAARIRKHMTGPVGRAHAVKPCQALAAPQRIEGAVDMLRYDRIVRHFVLCVRLRRFAVFVHHCAEERLHLFGGLDVAAVGDGPAHGQLIILRKFLLIGLRQRPPAANELARIVQLQLITGH